MAQTITPTIVTVNTVVTTAPTVSQLQQSGAIVSTGGTTLATGSYQYCGTPAQGAALAPSPLALTSLAWASNLVTATATAALPLSVGETFSTKISGAVPAGYNGTYLATVTGADTFTYPMVVNPGSETVPGTYTSANASFVQNAITTFFAQGGSVGVYILELGAEATDAEGISALEDWIVENGDPQVFYSYLVPPQWDQEDAEAQNTLTANYESPSGQTYFFVTTSVANVSTYAANKAVFATVPSPTQAPAEVQSAVPFYNWLVNKPGPANQLAPMSYRYGFGVTPWERMGNATDINTVLTASGNLILTGAEGGISTATLYKGTLMNGTQASSWYGIDWFRIQVKQALAAAIINGSNQQPPLLYDQSGINTLLAVAQNVANSAVNFGCALSCVVSAVDFVTYTQENPNDYANGIYNGFSAVLVTQNAFLTVEFFLDATSFTP